MVNIQNAATARTIAADLASMLVSTNDRAAPTAPVRTIGVQAKRAALPVGVAFGAIGQRRVSPPTLDRTEIAPTKPDLVSSGLILIVAMLACPCYVNLGLAHAWPGLLGSKLRTALIRTKPRLPVSPVLKLLVAPLADKYAVLAGIFEPLRATMRRAESAMAMGRDNLKVLTTELADKGDPSALGKPKAFSRTILTAFIVKGITSAKGGAAMQTRSHHTLYTTLDCVGCQDLPLSKGRLPGIR
jgi:hypothetical protein